MVNLDNSNKRLLQGLVRLLRSEVSGWSTNSEYDVDNVWSKNLPSSAEDEFPRASVDSIAFDDVELSVDLDIRLREKFVKIVVFSESSGELETLIEDCQDAIENEWNAQDSNGNPYLGDWAFREFDGSSELTEEEDVEADLTYNRPITLIFETIRTTDNV